LKVKTAKLENETTWLKLTVKDQAEKLQELEKKQIEMT